ncbi:MAG: carbamate kinase [Rhodospirillaceae bacterium]
MLVVAALGGNALLRRCEPLTWEVQQVNARIAATALGGILAAGHRLIVTHGNGPQVGLLALQAAGRDDALPFDALDAATGGTIGYLIERELRSVRPGGDFATVLTQVEVDPADPAFGQPEKPVGPVYRRAEAERLAGRFGWIIAPEGEGWRRVVASPSPRRILGLECVRLLSEAGVAVICTGGGGIPVAGDGRGGWRGIEAVIDKDRASALLARGLSADALLLLTDVKGVYRHFGDPGQELLTAISATDVPDLGLAPGSMGPKAEAALEFAGDAGGLSVIGALEDATEMLAGRAGTRVTDPGGHFRDGEG